MLIVVYIDECILFTKKDYQINMFLKLLRDRTGLNDLKVINYNFLTFDFTDDRKFDGF